MSPEGAIFIDIFGRANMGSFAKIFAEVNRMAKEEGAKVAESFSAGFDSMKAEYAGLVEVANEAYRDMELGLSNLRVAEARINELRAENFKRTSEEMVAAQKAVNDAIVEQQKLTDAAMASRDRSMLATPIGGGRRGRGEEPGEEAEDRGRRITPVPTLGRAGNALGFGAFAATALGGFDALRDSARMQDSLNKLITQSQENPLNIKGIEEAILKISSQTGKDPEELAKASMLAERRGYRGGAGGGDLSTMLRVASQLSALENVNLDEAIKALSITATSFKQTPDQLPDVASQLNRAVGRSGTTLSGFSAALPNFETIAGISGLKNQDVWAVLATLTKGGLEPERAGQNEASMIRSLSGQAGAPAQNMLNQLLTKANAGETAGDIYNQLGQRGIGGTIDEIFNKAINPNLTEDQKHVVLPAMFQNLQAERDINEGIGGLKTDAARRFVETNEQFKGGMLTPFKVRSTGKGGLGSKLLAEGATPEDIDVIAQLTSKMQQLHGLSNTLKNNQDDVQTIEAVLGKVFSTVEAGRGALILHNSNQQYQDTLADINAGKAEKGPDGVPNVEGTNQAMNTAAAQARRLRASIKGVAIALGDDMQGPLKEVLKGLADFTDFMKENRGALDVFAASIAAIGTAWVGLKAMKFGKGVFDDFAGAAKGIHGFFNPPAVGGKGASEVGQVNEGAQTAAAELKEGGAQAGSEMREGGAQAGAALKDGAAIANADLKEGATVAGADLKEGGSAAAVSIKESATGVGAELKEGAAAAAAELKEGAASAAIELKEGAAGAAGGLRGAGGPLGTALLGAGVADDALDRLGKKFPTGMPHDIINFIQNNPATGVGAYHWLFGNDGKSRGGIVGYDDGGKVADPKRQPLMGMPDMKRDSILGMLPGGKPVGLRGGEGILTPETVAALGGKEGVDALNQGHIHFPHEHTKGEKFPESETEGNPWSNPLSVGATFFGSFAKGMGRTHFKWAKFLQGPAQSFNDIANASQSSLEKTDEEFGHGRHRGTPAEIERMLASGMTREQIMQTLGVTQGKRGGYEMGNGSYLSRKDKELLGLPIGHGGESKDLISALKNAGIDPRMYPLLEGFAKTEGSNPSGAYTLGFTDSQAGTTLDEHAQALRAQIQNRQSVAGPFPVGGTPQQQASWMATVVGQSGVQSDWQGNAQPPRQDYVNSIVGGFGKGWWGIGRSRGGVIPGYDLGGVVSGGASINPFAGLSGSVGSHAGAGIMPHPNIAPTDMPDGAHGSGTSNAFGGARGQGQVTGTGIMSPGQPGIPSRGEVGSPIAGPFAGRTGSDKSGVGTTAPPPPQPSQAPPAAHPSLTPQGDKPGTFASPSGDRNIQGNTSREYGKDNSSKGFGVGGGLIGTAESAASMAADAFAPGSGQAANMAFQLVNRAIGFGGQLAGILGEGLLTTFLPNNSPLADPGDNILGKAVLGIAGAHPGPKNMAGMMSAMQMKPKDDLDQGANQAKQVMPMVHMDHPTIHNYSNDHSETGNAIMKATFGLPVGGQA